MRQVHFVAFLQAQNCTTLPAAWRHPDARTDTYSPEYYQHIARVLEQADWNITRAAETLKVDRVTALLGQGAALESLDASGEPPLILAALAGHTQVVAVLLDRGAAHLKEEVMPRYAELIYNGFWFSPEREMLQALIDRSQGPVGGTVRVKLYKGSVAVTGRKSAKSLYSMEHVTFEEDNVYDQRDAEGFIKLNALRLRLLNRRDR